MFHYIKKNKLIFLIVFFALFVRILGVFPGHNPNHPDEPMSYSSAVGMIKDGDLDPRRYDYPSGVPLLHYIFYNSIIFPIVIPIIALKHPEILILGTHDSSFMTQYSSEIFGRNEINAIFWSRLLTAILGGVSVYVVYLIGKKLFNNFAALAGSLFLAVNYRHVLSSHIALSDIPNSFFAILSFYFSLLLLENNSRNRYLLAGLFVALSISMKYQVFTILPFLFAHLVWVFKKRKLTELFNKNFILALIVILVVFSVLNPYLFMNLETALPFFGYIAGRYGAGTYKFYYYPLFYLFHWGIGKLAFVIVCLGLLFALLKPSIKTFLILTYVIPFLFVFLYYFRTGYIRNFTTVMPFFALFFGYFFFFIGGFFKKIFPRLIALIIYVFILTVSSMGPFENTMTLAVNYTKEWNRDALNRWIYKNIPKNSQLRVDNVSVDSYGREDYRLVAWSHFEENSISEFSKNNDVIAVINLDWHQGWMFWFGMPNSELLHYQDVPYDRLKDSYYGLALSEFENYAVKDIYKPWQAPDNNYIVMKIPVFPKSLGKKIESFSFDDGLDGWKYYDFSLKKGMSDLEWNREEGRGDSGSLILSGKTAMGTRSRVISPFIPISAKKWYVIKGLIKADTDVPSFRRDGFLRVDFFNNNKELGMGGITKAVSGRFFGNDWAEKEILVHSPEQARYMTISFQRTDPSAIKYWMDDVFLFETKEPVKERFNKLPYVRNIIPDNVLFPIRIY